MRFKGKVSWWFYAVIIGVAAILIPIIVISAFVDKNIVVLAINLLMLVTIELFCALIIFHNFVELQEESLLVVFGFIKKKIPYSDIAAISTTHDPSSSLAASFDRIEIKYGNRCNLMIAVVDKEGFLDEIKKGNPHITIL